MTTRHFGPDVRAIAREAYIYAFPMLETYRTMQKHIASTKDQGGFGEFASNPLVLAHENRDVVTPNNDTVYSSAWIDLRAEPWVLSVPAIEPGNYYSVHAIDFFTLTTALLGVNSTGCGAGNYLFVGPNWSSTEENPSGINGMYRCETSLMLLLTRTQLHGSGIESVKAIQEHFQIQSLSSYLRVPEVVSSTPLTLMTYEFSKARSHDFIIYFNWLLSFSQPPHPSENDICGRFASIGIGPGLPWDANKLLPDFISLIDLGVADAKEAIDQGILNMRGSKGYFGNRQAMQGKYLERAVAAAVGLFGLPAEEAWYGGLTGDGKGDSVLHMTPDEIPPAKFFWSISLYTLPDRFFYPNSLSRHSLGGKTPDLKYGSDGSLTIFVGQRPPASPWEPNWLPAPTAKYSIVLRIYGPKPEVLDGRWKSPVLRPLNADNAVGDQRISNL